MIEGTTYDGVEVKFFNNWDDFLVGILNRNEKNISIISHYGGGFDYLHFIINCNELKKYKYEIIHNNSRWIMAILKFEGKTIRFLDTFNLLPKSLKELCVIFKKIEHKKKDINILDIENIYKNNLNEFREYLSNDVKSLWEIIQEYMKILNINYVPVTIASNALYIYRKEFQKYPLYKIQDGYYNEMIYQSYAGGRVECYKQDEVKNVSIFDVNSLYPYVMQTCKYPYGAPIYTKKYIPDKLGFYNIKFEQNNLSIQPIFWKKDEYNGLNFRYGGSGCFYSSEIELALNNRVDIEIIDGFYWKNDVDYFSSFVKHFYEKKESNDNYQTIYKLILNSLYGKFAQKEICSHLEYIPDFSKIDYRNKIIKEYIPELCFFEVEEEKIISNHIPYISSAITANARVFMYDFLKMYKNNIMYMDTDSLHIKDYENLPLKLDLSEKIGDFKLECVDDVIYLGRKQYALVNSKKMKYKGIKTEDKLSGNSLTIDDYKKLLSGQTINYTFQEFPKLKSCLKGKIPCKKIEYNQTLTKGSYLSYKSLDNEIF